MEKGMRKYIRARICYQESLIMTTFQEDSFQHVNDADLLLLALFTFANGFI